jgi:hypothetical protein
MHDGAKTEQLQARDQDRAIAEVLCKLREIMEAREAANPTPESSPGPPPEPWVDKPGTLIAAEKDVALWEVVEKLRPALCGGPERCRQSRCRRARRCGELEQLRPMIEASRATLARERAQWKPPSTPPEPPIRRRRRG